MRKLSKIMFLVMVFMMISVLKVNAEQVDSGTCGENLTWTLDDKGVLVISGEGEMENYGDWNADNS